MPKKKPLKGKPVVHKELDGFDIQLNEFGEVISNLKMDKLNEFLNERVDDKKLRDREDLDKPTDESAADEDSDEVDGETEPDLK